MNSIENKVVMITGASAGIGKATALRLAKEKVNLVLVGGRNVEKLKECQDEAIALGAGCCIVPGNLTDKTVLEGGIKAAIDSFGGIDVLINNAGSAFSCPFEQVTEEAFDEIMELDVKVPFILTQKVVPFLRKSSSATIVNIASIVAHSGYANQSAYSMAKHALLGFSQSLSKELYKEGIRVHVLSPGGVYTDMVKKTRPDLTGDNMIMPEDIADVIAFLLTNRNNAVIDEIMLHRINKEPF